MTATGTSALDAYERIAEPICAFDADWRFTHANPALAALAGYSPEDLIGRTLWETFPWLVGTDFEHRHLEAQASGERVDFEAQVHSDGPWFTIRLFPSSTGLTACYEDATALREVLESLKDDGRRQSALAQFGYRALDAATIDWLLRDAASTVAQTLRVPWVKVVGRPLAGAPLQVVAESRLEEGGGELEPGAIAASFLIPNLEDAELVVHTRDGRTLPAGAASFVEAVVATVSGTVRRLEVNSRLQHLALQSQVTKLPNRRYLMDHLARLLEEVDPVSGELAVVAIEPDRKWLLTSTYGNRTSDAISAALGERLRRIAEPHAMIAHIPRDVFVLVVEAIDGEHTADRLIARINAAMLNPIRLPSGEHFIDFRFGVAYGRRGSHAEDLLDDAETALQNAGPPDNVAVFDQTARAAALQQIALERDLHGAVARGEFTVFYQPLIELSTRKPSVVEALVRWQHPTLGLLGPCEFIAAAEDNGLIVELGAWVLEQTCRQVAYWQTMFGVPLRASVNISPRQLADPGFGRTVEAVVAATGLQPPAVKLEITERMLIHDQEGGGAILKDLRNRGFRVAIDDFGTGYSSLSYLRRLEVDALKIDRSFIAGIRDTADLAIIEAIIKMGHALGIDVVAEGVEEPEQEALLERLGCDRVQGYRYSRPLPADQMEQFLKTALG